MPPSTMMTTPAGTRVPIPARTYIVFRPDGRIERTCRHGVGHPIGHRIQWQPHHGIHGCDGCCAKWTTP